MASRTNALSLGPGKAYRKGVALIEFSRMFLGCRGRTVVPRGPLA